MAQGREVERVTEAERAERLARARRCIFSAGLSDGAAKLCAANLQYGLAKIHFAQERLGLEPEALFIGTPDMTITRNVSRWASGFGYGGKAIWGPGDRELVVLDLKPNGCGMLVGWLDRVPPVAEVLERVQRLQEEQSLLDGVRLSWEFGKSNHFVDILEVHWLNGRAPAPYAFIAHFSGEELRGPTDRGPGLYYDSSPPLLELAQVIATPFGPLRVLTGERAREYFEYYRYVEDFVRRRRLLAAERLFDELRVVANKPHQGLLSLNEMVLGCHAFEPDSDALYPLVLRADLPAYLVRGKPNLSGPVLDRLGLRAQAEEMGALEHLWRANVIPHGAGYALEGLDEVVDIHEVGSERYFEMADEDRGGRRIVANVREIPYRYRGAEVARRAFELELAEPVAELRPLFALKV